MKVIYHPRYEEVYASDPAAAPGRMESILREISHDFEIITLEPASAEDVLLVHTEAHLRHIQNRGLLYEVALLAAGGAIRASELAMSGEPAFAALRPPGHHASPERCWGFCFFNNMAISIARLRARKMIDSALIVDIDLLFPFSKNGTLGRHKVRCTY